MKTRIKALIAILPRGLSAWLQGWLWKTRATCIRLACPLVRAASWKFGGSGLLASWPKGIVALVELDGPVVPAGIALPEPESTARTLGAQDLAGFADAPEIAASAELVEVRDCRIDGRTSALIDSSGRLVVDLSTYAQCSPVERPWDHPVFRRFGARARKQLPGTSVLLASPNGSVYFHWLLELFPRLLLMKRSGMLGDDYRCLVSGSAPFVTDSLAAAGVEKDKILTLEPGKEYVAERLLSATDLHPQSSAADLAPLLRDVFLGKEAPAQGSGDKMIYISRRDAGLRTVVGEQRLTAIVEELGGVSVVLEGLGIQEQARIFNNANVVIAPHGSSLTNLVFCRPGTKVLELFSPGYVRLLYPRIGAAMKLDYWYLIGRGKSEERNKPQLYADINIDPALFRSTLETMAA